MSRSARRRMRGSCSPLPSRSTRPPRRHGTWRLSASQDQRRPAQVMAMGSMSEPEGSDTGGLTVGQASARLGVAVRALHHWDEIGLAQPSLRTDSGYRLYMSADLVRLQRIV